MAERKSGAGKPPVIDLKPREPSQKSEPAPEAEAKPATPPPEDMKATEPVAVTDTGPLADDEPAKPTEAPTGFAAEPTRAAATEAPPVPPRPPARLAMPWSAISIAAAGGAVLGVLLTYLVGTWIPLPSQGPGFADPTEPLALLDERAEAAEKRIGTIEEAAIATRIGLDQTTTNLDARVGELRKAIADAEARIVPPTAIDTSALEAEILALSGRVDAMGAGASSADAAALVTRLGDIESELTALTTRLNEIAGAATAQDGRIATLDRELEAAKTSIAAQTQTLAGAEIGPAVKLPLLLSGLESAFAAGRPFATELGGLTTLLPDLQVPAPLAGAAAAGLPRPDVVEARFAEVLPQIIAGRTAQPSGDWSQDAFEWAKALLALRPVGEIEGETPEARVSRLEAAVGRRDFVAAAAELAALPEPMRNAAGAVGTDITALAAAETFVAGLRVQALAPASAEANP